MTEDTPARHHVRKSALSPEEADYRRRRKQYINRLGATPTQIVIHLDPIVISRGKSSRGTQYRSNGFSEETQCSPIHYTEVGNQIPQPLIPKRFPSMVHFIRAASNSILSILDQAEFTSSKSSKQPVTKIQKLPVTGTPVQVHLTKNSTAVLIESGRILVWNAQSSENNACLVSTACVVCFAFLPDSNKIVGGCDSGCLAVWNVDYSVKNVQPFYQTDEKPLGNHKLPIVAVAPVGAGVASLDQSGTVCFWSLNDGKLIRAEMIKITPSYSPASTLAIYPTSVTEFLVGLGPKVFNCSRFGIVPSPPSFPTRSRCLGISFNPFIPTVFVAACSDGNLMVFSKDEADPLLTIQVEVGSADIVAVWSATRASVIFAADKGGSRLHIYDLTKNMKRECLTQSVGSAIYCIDTVETSSGTVLAVGDGSSFVNVNRVSEELSNPLNEGELALFKLALFSEPL